MIFFYEIKEKLKKNLMSTSKNKIFKKKNQKKSKKNLFKLKFSFQSVDNYILKIFTRKYNFTTKNQFLPNVEQFLQSELLQDDYFNIFINCKQ